MYLAAFRVVLKILVLLQPLFVALFLLLNIISEIIIDYYWGLILLPGADRPLAPPPPLLRHWYTYIFLIRKIDHRNINFKFS